MSVSYALPPSAVTVHSLSETLRRLRSAKGMTQKDLSIFTGFDRAYVNRIEGGKQPPVEGEPHQS